MEPYILNSYKIDWNCDKSLFSYCKSKKQHEANDMLICFANGYNNGTKYVEVCRNHYLNHKEYGWISMDLIEELHTMLLKKCLNCNNILSQVETMQNNQHCNICYLNTLVIN